MQGLLFESDLQLRTIPFMADDRVAERLDREYLQSIRSRMHHIDDSDRSRECSQHLNLERLK